ncbi:retrotransposon protein, putative, ty1-copia subclass [Tanacetum coccineum]|uniref:Retrotransposon protein, putative, ty1-copia subclass n=1 Tax=Tanacetum coccineum TaxID=301880 RepID=A0ABQ5GXS0_9ASTR
MLYFLTNSTKSLSVKEKVTIDKFLLDMTKKKEKGFDQEGILKKDETLAILAIGGGKIQKDKKKAQRANGKDKGKTKIAYAPKAKIPPPPKRDNSENDSIYYHCKEKRTEKLQRDRILQPTHDELLEKCKSYISRKIAHKPFPHQVERAKDLLGLIHTDVCGRFSTVSREGASYFITFTNDFSRYGYVYLMKHKHEVFETFKVFQNEVENQLKKKIKDVQSDRGGEYLSHEFINDMKSCAIVSQLTPPYTPQHNGVSERRNELYLFFENSLTLQEAIGSHKLLEASESDVGLEVIQEDDTQPSKNTSDRHNEVEYNEVEPHSVEVPICRSGRISQEPDRYCFYVDPKEHESGDLNGLILLIWKCNP